MSLSQKLRYPRSIWFISLLAAMAVLSLAACGGSTSTPASPTTAAPTTAATSASTPSTAATTSSTSAQEVDIKIVENNEVYSFSPASVTIAKGTKVVWTNTTDAPHTVTPDTANAFTASSNVAEDQTYSFVFTTAGTFSYHCNIHSYMKGTITVTSSPTMKPQ